MSRVVKSDKLKAIKQEGQMLRPDVAPNEKVLLKKPTGSRTFQTPTTHVAGGKERNHSKPLKAAAAATNNAKIGLHKVGQAQMPVRTNGISQTNKLMPRKTSAALEQKHVPLPLRAKKISVNSKSIKETIQNISATQKDTKANKKQVYKKHNSVLETPQNVTVCSPPPKKKNDVGKVVINEEKGKENSKLARKGSRTLAPDEIVMLKTESARMRSENEIQKEMLPTERLREPVAFEITFEDKNVPAAYVPGEQISPTNGQDNNNEELNYSDDFESYESDFETDSSTNSPITSDPPSLKDETKQIKTQATQIVCDGCKSGTDSDVIPDPKNQIQNDEKSYDQNHSELGGAQSKRDSSETCSLSPSEHLNYGKSSNILNKYITEVTFGGYRDFFTKPIINQRGSELMKKIQLNILSYDLVDLKPISYDIFMQTFGKLNTKQNSTQTQGDQTNTDQQTDVRDTRSIWTQHPTHFDLDFNKNCDENAKHNTPYCDKYLSTCELDQSLEGLHQLHLQSSKHRSRNDLKRQKKSINYEHLHSFLLRSSLLIDQILGPSNNKNKPTQNAAYGSDRLLKRACQKYFHLETNFLNTLQVLKIFSNNKHNLLVTVHESLPDTNVYTSDFSNLLMVWCVNKCDKPLRFLTTWSQVAKVEIPDDSSDIIVAALRDGSIALWDLGETHSFCSKLDGYLTHFAPTQSVIPSWPFNVNGSKLVMDMGACLDVKSFRSQYNNILTKLALPRTQFVSLYDSTIVTVWTLVETSHAFSDAKQVEKCEKVKTASKLTQTFEYGSPWARVKLMQSAAVNIKEYLKTKSQHSQSRFEKTKAIFQKNIYSDEALKELIEDTSEAGEQGLRFTSLECSSENIFICTNRNYILMCSRSLKMEKLKRLLINKSRLLFPTALKVLFNERFLAVGLSNGEVIILNCQTDKITQVKRTANKSTPLESAATNKDCITGKSCALQNILLNVQKSYEDMNFDRECRPSTTAGTACTDNSKKPFELKMFNQEVVITGSILRKNLIQSLELSSDGRYLIALANGHLRIYDFHLDEEFPSEDYQETGTIISIATGKCGTRENNLTLLRPNSKVEVHILNK